MTPAPANHVNRRPLLRLHVSAWFWLLLTAFLLFMAIVPGQRGRPIWNAHKIEHGWPLTYLLRDVDPWWSDANVWYITHDVIDFYPVAIGCDVLAAAGILGTVGFTAERRARARDDGLAGRRFPRPSWQSMLCWAAICGVATAWHFEQSRLIQDASSWEVQVSNWARTVLGDSLWMFIPVLLGAWAIGRLAVRRMAKGPSPPNSPNVRVATGAILGAAMLVWIPLRSIHLNAPWAALLADLVALWTLTLLLRILWRRWRAARAPSLHGWRWQFGMKGLLAAATVLPILFAGVTNYVTLALRLERAHAWTHPVALLEFLRPLDLLCAKLGLKHQFMEVIQVSAYWEGQSALAEQSLVAQFPQQSTVHLYGWNQGKAWNEQDLSQIHLYGGAWGLLLYDPNVQTPQAMSGFKELRWFRSWQHDSPDEPGTQLSTIAQCRKMRQLDLYCDRPGDEGFANVAGLTQLERLHITWSMTGRPTDNTCDFPELTEPGVWINDPGTRIPKGRITDAGLAHLAGLTRLEDLWLEGAEIRGPGLVSLHRLLRLRKLKLDCCPLDDNGLRFVNGCRALWSLDLSETEVSTLANLDWPNLPELRKVRLSGTRLPRSELTQLRSAHPGVRFVHDIFDQLDENRNAENPSIWVSHPLRPGHLAAIKEQPGLRTFSASLVVCDDDLQCIADQSELTYASLGASIGDAGLSHLSRLTALQTLDLKDAHVTGSGLRHLQNCQKLRNMDLERSQLTDVGMLHVGRLRGLDELNLMSTRVTAIGLEHLSELPELRKLCVDQSMLDSTVIPVFKSMPKLVSLGIRRNGDPDELSRWIELLQAKILRPSLYVYGY